MAPPGEGWECGRLTVALDADDPAGESIELAVTRRQGSRSRGEALVVNPGGPGGAGLPFVWSLAETMPPDVLRLFDIVSWDPRGVGGSTPGIECPRGARWSDADLVARCAAETGELMGHMSSPNHVDDLEELRRALGNERLNFLGFSYGSYLGALYANAHPDRVGRFVLDGVVHPSSGSDGAPTSDGSPWYADAGFEAAEERFFELCDRAPACELGTDSRSTYDDLAAVVADLPTDLYPGAARVDALTLASVVRSSMFDPFSWGVLATALEDAARGDASTVDALAGLFELLPGDFVDVIEPRIGNETIANFVIYCSDFQTVTTLPTYCDGMPANAQVPEIRAVEVVEPLLMIGTAFDPSTPERHTAEMADRLGDAVELYWDGVGHTAFPFNSLCIDDVVARFLIDGDVPADGERCPFVDGVDDDEAIAEYVFELPPLYVEPWLTDVLAETWGDDDAGCGAAQLSGAGDRIVTHVVLGVDSLESVAAIDKAASACRGAG